MPSPLLLALASAACFLALAYAAVKTPATPFLRLTAGMAAAASLLVLISPAAAAALVAPVLLSRRLAVQPIPATVDELLRRR